MKSIFLLIFGFFASSVMAISIQEQGKTLYETRCAMCHGVDARGTGWLAKKSYPPANDLTSPIFQKRLKEYPGVIVSSIVLMPNGTLIPDTLKANGVELPKKDWKASELRAVNEYLLWVIKRNH